jgi:ABC-2 type transport system ATP-binding protein
LLDLILLEQGTIELFGQKHNELSKTYKQKIGVVGENLGLLDELSGYEYLKLIGKIYAIPADILAQRMKDLFSYFFENEADSYKNIATYSTGMRKKIAFCAAVIHTPDLLILDEPFSGLDPLVANQMVVFIKKYHNPNRVIFISSHDLTYVEKVATKIGVLDNKNLVFNSTLQDFTENGEEKLDAALLKILKPNEAEIEKINWL